MNNYFKLLGFRTTLVIAIGKLFNSILKSINYYDVHLPLKNEILACRDLELHVSALNNLVCVHQKDVSQIYLLRPGTSDLKVFKQVILEKEYLTLIHLISDLKAEDSIKTIIDAGANIGLTTLFFKQHYPLAKIITIEPDPSNYDQQLKNLKINHSSNSIIPLNKALWHNNIDKLNISDEFRDGDAWSKSVVIDNDHQGKICSVTLSDLSNEYLQNALIDILKIDIEGAEGVLFDHHDFMETLKTQVRFLSLEIHEECNDRTGIIGKLESSNFTVAEVGETTFCINKSLLQP